MGIRQQQLTAMCQPAMALITVVRFGYRIGHRIGYRIVGYRIGYMIGYWNRSRIGYRIGHMMGYRIGYRMSSAFRDSFCSLTLTSWSAAQALILPAYLTPILENSTPNSAPFPAHIKVIEGCGSMPRFCRARQSLQDCQEVGALF